MNMVAVEIPLWPFVLGALLLLALLVWWFRRDRGT